MNRTKTFSILIGIAAVAGVGYLVLKNSGDWNKKSETSNVALGENPVDKGTLTETYASPDFGFSFNYPKDFTVSELDDETGHTVLLQKQNAREGFQIYISVFDEPFDPAQGKPGPITPERIKQDLPDMIINAPQEVLIGEKKDIPALIFLSKHESLGDVREVWFVWPFDPAIAGNYLFQLTAYADMDNFVGPILETLRFQ